MEDSLQILLALFGGGAITTLITFFVNRHDKKDEALKNMEDKFQKGLDDREATGKERYLEHKEAICTLSLEHKRDFQTLIEAIKQLTENDTKTTELIATNQKAIDNVSAGMIGIIHNTIIHTTDNIMQRGAVTFEELSSLEGLYEPYHRLGGNGEVKLRYEAINELPTISKEEAVKRDRAIEKEKFKEIISA